MLSYYYLYWPITLNAGVFILAQATMQFRLVLADEKGASVDTADTNGSTALMLAAHGGHLEVVKYLADEKDASVDAANANGLTALMQATTSYLAAAFQSFVL